ncbi:carbohydrate sulfotransferase 9-like [Pelobates fuscus]|uniref:carbohydrate sulfotransferase 9-like n=1 Tax=Pelobates fuscus TaxID=191477 RepID=UPI002FE4DF58
MSLVQVFGDGTNEISITQQNRKSILKSACPQRNLSDPLKKIDLFHAKRLFVEKNHKLIYCEVPKVGCSNWKRIIFLLKTNISVRANYIDHEAIHSTKFIKRLSDFPPEQQQMMLQKYTKVMFTRDPLQRIVSAYRDKFLHSGGYYGDHIANRIKSMFRKKEDQSKDNISFEEFVRYLIQKNPKNMDIHWMPMHQLCDPCNINYDILGKFATLKTDSDYVLKVIGAPASIRYPDIKQYNESRTDEKISKYYLSKLPLPMLERLAQIYKLDYILFDYL